MIQAKDRKSVIHPKNPVYAETITGNSGPVSVYFVSGELTGKERDPETGLYYYGARYLDPRTSRWLSVDPAMGEYIPLAPINDDARKQNQNLRGLGGIFNYINFHVYHYAGNNPVRILDPDGEAQTEGQKLYTAILARRFEQLDNAQRVQFKSDFSIVITRSGYDNENNGQYYQSTLSIMYRGETLNTINIQSTADHPNTVSEFNGKTLPSGTYTGTLLRNSPSYLRPIHLVDGVNAMEYNVYLIHGNQQTNIPGSEPTNKPYSAGCLIPRIDDFNEMIDILTSLGFVAGDTINVTIIDPIQPSFNNYW